MNRAMAARWQDIARVADGALDLPAEGRPDFIRRECAGDEELHAEVERLLEAAASSGDGFLGASAAADAAPLLAWTARQALPPGTRFGAYELVSECGRGGMATVYVAQDHKHNRRVAVKVLHTEVAAAVVREWFLREIAIAAALHHPHILPVHDSGEADGLLYFVMPLVDGESLRERLTREGQLPLAGALRLVHEVAEALDYAHRQGIVHCDIKPENILLQDGQAVVADFGIARAFAIGSGGVSPPDPSPAIGTPAYMSPEQMDRLRRPDGRADIYALGCVLHEMLAGSPAFGGRDAALREAHMASAVASLHAIRPDVPAALEAVVKRALHESPAERFATAGEFLAAVDAAVRTVASHQRRRRLAIGFGGAAAAAVAIAALVLRPGTAPANPDPALVAVLPFRTAGAAEELGWLSEGLVDLLSIKLGTEGGWRTRDPAAVLRVWRRAVGPRGPAADTANATAIARNLGAGRFVQGSVVGTAERVTLTASIGTVAAAGEGARASESGPLDSLPLLVDRIAARLLALDAGVDAGRIPATSGSLASTRAFLAGRVAFRAGNFSEAASRYRESTLLDSTFALAALELVHASVWSGGAWGEDGLLGKRLAQSGRTRLGPGDRALLDAWDVEDITGPAWIQGWEAAARANPDRAETWYELGDAYYHFGAFVGLPDHLRRASAAFRRGWAIDSAGGTAPEEAGQAPIIAEPLVHMVEIAQIEGDSASVRRLVAARLRADSTGDDAWYLRWHRALASGDAAMRSFWADSALVPAPAWDQIAVFMSWTGVGTRDFLGATNMGTRLDDGARPGEITTAHQIAVLNGGRPREARRLLLTDDADPAHLAGRILDALYWGGDSAAAADAVRRLGPSALARARASRKEWRELRPLCAVSAWRAAQGNLGPVAEAIATLRALGDTDPARGAVLHGQYATLCAALLDATVAAAGEAPDAVARVARADIAARTYPQWPALGASLVVARAAEAQGDLGLALRALRRRADMYGQFPWYLSTFVREEGRLAALTGDTAGAVRAYRHYLALRPTPEPGVRPEVERVRAALSDLESGRAALARRNDRGPPD